MDKTARSPAHVELMKLLRNTRTANGLTQAQVAERLGKKQSFVSKYESGERLLDVIEFIYVARALDSDPRQLFKKVIAFTNTSDQEPL